MKFGMRTPNIKKSIKARTTGKIKRKAKKACNPLYGKKGIGYIKNPERAIKNSIYHKTTFGFNDVVKNVASPVSRNNKKNTNKWVDFFLCLFLGYFGVHKFYEGKIGIGIIYLFTLGLFGIGWVIDIFAILFQKQN